MSTIKGVNVKLGIQAITQSMGEHLSGAIRGKNQKVHGNLQFFTEVEEVIANHCIKYRFDIDTAMPALLTHYNKHIKKRLPGGKWDALAMAKPYCAFLYALRNTWSHPKGRSDELTSRILSEFVPPHWRELVSQCDLTKKKHKIF